MACSRTRSRFFSSKIDWKKLRPMIHERIQNRAKYYPLTSMIPVAQDVLNARASLIKGVHSLLNFLPVKSCKFCPEICVGEEGHRIRSCPGFKRVGKNFAHRWLDAKLKDIVVPVEAFHLKNMFQEVIKHDQRFDFDRVPAVIELCYQAGAHIPIEALQDYHSSENDNSSPFADEADLSLIAPRTLEAWENLRSGVRRLLLVYPAKVCERCKEVHIGPSGHKARLCGVFKNESFRGNHWWKKAEVDDIVPAKISWHRRVQDPLVLVNGGRDFYGHAPAVVELCYHAGARVPPEYYCMMKELGLPGK